jgi:peptide-methionine (S)-S-oxide reductase
MNNSEKATFGAGCFWGVEESFRKLKGVNSTIVGYTGGYLPNPTYETVCNGDTGYIEVVQIDFDPNIISYNELLETFWAIHDPTSLNRQGADIGVQYRSAIFTQTEEQEILAAKSKEKFEKLGKFSKPIVTDIKPITLFYPAEEHHQKYVMKHNS